MSISQSKVEAELLMKKSLSERKNVGEKRKTERYGTELRCNSKNLRNFAAHDLTHRNLKGTVGPNTSLSISSSSLSVSLSNTHCPSLSTLKWTKGSSLQIWCGVNVVELSEPSARGGPEGVDQNYDFDLRFVKPGEVSCKKDVCTEGFRSRHVVFNRSVED